ncbi:MAG: extracellular solute-binding protein [Chloroflexota bacterium]
MHGNATPIRSLILLVAAVMLLWAMPVAPQDAEPTTVTLAYNSFLELSFTDAPAPLDVIREAVAARDPSIEIEFFVAPDTVEGFRDAIVVFMTSQDGEIDIYGMDAPWVLEFGRAGWAVPLNDALPELEANFVSAGLDIFSYEGDRLGVPFWGSVGGLFYRADLLDEYGFEPPATYDELVEQVEAITADNPDLTGFTYPAAKAEALVQVWTEFFNGFGGTFFDADGTCTMNSEAGVEALSFMVNLIESGATPENVTAWDAAEARLRFVEGDAIFLRHNQDIITWLDNPERSAIGGQWGFTQNPAQPNGTPTGATGGFAFAANPFSDTPEATRIVLEVIASEEVQRGFALAWGPVQYYDGLYEDTEVAAANPNSELLGEVLPSAAPRPQSTSYSQLSQIIQDEVHAALTGGKSPADALNDACARVGRIR